MADDALEVTTATGEREGTTILRLVGPLTLRNLFGFQNDFRALTPPVLVVDMTEVHYIDSAGLGLLVNGHVSAERHGRVFRLAGVSPRVFALMEMTRVHTVMRLFPTVSEAEFSA